MTTVVGGACSAMHNDAVKTASLRTSPAHHAVAFHPFVWVEELVFESRPPEFEGFF
jgi:hypothetical protein